LDFAPLEAARQAGTTILDQLHLDAGMTSSIAHQERREQSLDVLWRRRHSQQSGLSALESTRPVAERIRLRQQATPAPKEVLAFGRELNAASDAIEQANSKLGLEGVDLTGERRLRDAHPIGRAREGPSLGDCHEIPEVPQFYDDAFCALIVERKMH